MRVIVYGDRGLGRVSPNLSRNATASAMATASKQRQFMTNYLYRLHAEIPITLLITSREGGISSIISNWALMQNIPTMLWRRLVYPKSSILKSMKLWVNQERTPDNIKESIEARNERMLSGGQADLVIAFGGGETTRLFVKAANEKGMRVFQIDIPDFTNSWLCESKQADTDPDKEQVLDWNTFETTPTNNQIGNADPRIMIKVADHITRSTSPLQNLDDLWRKRLDNQHKG